jgi:4-amino-4-deoxy-L-arabinose transferase-like glycosyltransferase
MPRRLGSFYPAFEESRSFAMTVLTSPEFRVIPGERFSRSFAPIVMLVAVHFLFLALFFGPAISTPDANGYMAQARLIAREGRTDIVVESPAQYVGDHWIAVAEGRYYGQYPPGMPAMLAVVFRPFGWYPTLWVIPVMGSLSLLGLYLVVREWVGAGWALVAAALMAVNPFANQHALGADSHTAVCFFLIWALYGLICWERS